MLLGHARSTAACSPCAAVVTFAMWRFVRSPFGLTLRGIRDSESRMRSLGYNVPLHLFIAFHGVGFLRRRRRRALCDVQQFRQPVDGGSWRSRSRAC